MALAEVYPLGEPERFVPSIVPSIEAPPLQEPELGIDDNAIRRLREVILDRTVELPPSGRNMGEHRGIWQEDSVLDYCSFLGRVLNLKRNRPDEPHLMVDDITRASKINFGPSLKIFRNVLGSDEWMDKVDNRMDLPSRSSRKGWSIEKAVQQGRTFIAKLKRRPTLTDFSRAGGNEDFLGIGYLNNHFGSAGEYFELLGCVNARSFKDTSEYEEWGAAVKLQNGADMVFDNPTLQDLASRELGPTKAPIYKNFKGGMSDFDRRVDQRYKEITKAASQDRQAQLKVAKSLRTADEAFEAATDLLDDDALARFTGIYRLTKDMAPSLPNVEAVAIAEKTSPYAHIDSIIAANPAETYMSIKARAKELAVHTSIWGTRFSHIDLTVPNPKRKVVPQTEPSSSAAADVAPQRIADPRDTDAIRERARLRRLARLAGAGAEPKKDTIKDFNVARFAKKGSELTPDEMEEMQNIIKKGARKTKRLELFVDRLEPDEKLAAEEDVRHGQQAQEAFIKANTGLVYSLVRYRLESGVEVETLTNAGSIGLVEAIKRFDPRRGYKFSTYAMFWIRKEVFDCARQEKYGVALTKNDEAKLVSARKYKEDVTKRTLELEPLSSVQSLDKPHEDTRQEWNAYQLAANTDVAEVAILNIGRSDATDIAESTTTDPTESVIDYITDPRLSKIIQELSTQEQGVLALHTEGCGHNEIAERMNIPVGTIPSIVHRVRNHIREHYAGQQG